MAAIAVSSALASSLRFAVAPLSSPVSSHRSQSALSTSRSTLQFGYSSTFGHQLRGFSSSEGEKGSIWKAGLASVFGASSMGAAHATAAVAGNSLHDFTVKDINGNDVSLSQYKGKVALVVNVASACGLTQSNYKELTELYNQYKDQGLVVLAFPSNQFGAQEPGSNEQIKEFVCSRFKADFPLFDKVDVNGANTAPVYQWLKSQKGGGILGSNIKWNFGKFLVDKDGNVVERYAPTTSPKSIEADIKKLL
eukprot:jgi/Mesen1/2743/ME000169S01910